MYFDASSIVAMLLREPEADDMLQKLAVSERCVTSVVTIFETILAVAKKTGDRQNASRQVRQFLRLANVEIVRVDVASSDFLIEAVQNYHRGSGHSAKLNFGDCIAYAVDKNLGLRLFYKGNDFSQTDMA